MTLTLIADEFGLLHAAVPHPCDAQRRVQVMVLQAEDGWWCYVDGERVNGSFPSSQHAGQAAAAEIDKLRMLADEAVKGEQLAIERATSAHKTSSAKTSRFARPSPSRGAQIRTAKPFFRVSGTAIAACVAVMVLAFTGYVVHATGVLETDDVRHTGASENETGTVAKAEVLPASPSPKMTTAAAAHMTAVAVEAAPRARTASTLQPAPGRKTTVPTLPRTKTAKPETVPQELPSAPAFATRHDLHEPGFLSQRTTASLRSSAVVDVEEAPVPAVIPRHLVRQPQRATAPKRKYRGKSIRSRAAAKRRARRVRRNLRSRASNRALRARARPSRRAFRRAKRRIRARKVRRVYRAAFGRTSQR